MTTGALKSKPKVETIKSGIAKRDTTVIAKALSEALADSFTLYLKTLGVHWNVVGAAFYSLHKLTEAQYEDLDAANDMIAERIRALGHMAPASFADFAKFSVLDSSETLSSADDMIQSLIADNESASKRMREFVAIASAADDVFTADMLTARIGKHEQNAWMLRAIVS